MPADDQLPAPVYKCGDCGSTKIVIELPPAPWEANPEDWCFHQHPAKPAGVCAWVHPKSEPCDLRRPATFPE